MQSTSEPSSHELGEAGEIARSGESSGFILHREMQDSVDESDGVAGWGHERGETVMGEQQRLGGLGNGGDQDAANSLGSDAIKLELGHSTNDLERMDVDDGEIHSSNLPHVTGPEKEPRQDHTEKMRLSLEGHERIEYPGFADGRYGQPHPSLTPTKATDSRRHEETANPGLKDQMTADMDGLQSYQNHSLTEFVPIPYYTLDIPTSFGSFSTPDSYNPRFQSYPQQQPFTQLNQFSFDPNFDRQQQRQVQVDNKKRQENAQKMYEQNRRQAQQANNDFGFSQNQAGVPASILMAPLSYQRAPQSAHQTLPFGNNSTNYQSQVQFEFPYDQTASKQPPASYSAQNHDTSSQTTKSRNQLQSAYTTPEAPEGDTKEEYSSDDDEPLKTRLKRHPSAAPSPQPPSPINWKLPDYDIHFSHSPPPASSSSKPKLTKDSSLPVAKISLPGLIREPLVLSPDHTAQELSLLTNIFLPGQQALATPDPEPALAVLNFHSIAMMVVEAYVQFEIGDEMGRSGPSYRSHYDSESDDEDGGDADGGAAKGKGKGKKKAKAKEESEYVRIRCARTANVDDIFFAVIDRWRAGLESNKKSFKLIRGIQEFVDVALDVIFWIKENGLLVEEERAGGDKDGGRAAGRVSANEKGGNKEGKAKAKEGAKEEGISMLTARKKPAPKTKVEKPKKKEAPVRKRRVPVTPGVTVVRKK